MTLFGWDASHFDGPLSTAILARAKAEGIAFFTHKIAESLQDTEGGRDDTALAAARDAGVEFVGGYLIPRSNASVAAQVDYWLRLADQGEPWWREYPGWFWQIDLERWSYDNVSAATGIAAAQQLRARTSRWTVLYASHGQYGDQLTAWDGPLWNADYTSRPAAGFAAMYPGDVWQPLHSTWRGGWAPYSGREPTILQYTSSATIAGLSTCDANAYRGSLDQLRALIERETDMNLTDPVPGTSTPNHPGDRTVQDVLHDSAQLRALLIGELPLSTYPADSPLVQSLTSPSSVALTDADRAAIAEQVVTLVGAKLDLVLARLQAAGVALADG